MTASNDPIGHAIADYNENTHDSDIVVVSDICDDDTIPLSYLCREYEDMSDLERLALKECSGRILDVGAGAGMHASYLHSQNKEVLAIDISPKAIKHIASKGVNAELINYFDYDHSTFDTILMLMNGLGIAGTLANLESTLLKTKSLLRENGKILCDSSDIKYLYEDDEGGNWIDLNSEYYGNFKFQMKYKDHISDWFNWLYVDFDRLSLAADSTGFKIAKLYEDDNHYLAQLTLI